MLEEQTDAGEQENRMMNALEANGGEIEKQKKRLKYLCDVLDEQKEKLENVFEKLEIEQD